MHKSCNFDSPALWYRCGACILDHTVFSWIPMVWIWAAARTTISAGPSGVTTAHAFPMDLPGHHSLRNPRSRSLLPQRLLPAHQLAHPTTTMAMNATATQIARTRPLATQCHPPKRLQVAPALTTLPRSQHPALQLARAHVLAAKAQVQSQCRATAVPCHVGQDHLWPLRKTSHSGQKQLTLQQTQHREIAHTLPAFHARAQPLAPTQGPTAMSLKTMDSVSNAWEAHLVDSEWQYKSTRFLKISTRQTDLASVEPLTLQGCLQWTLGSDWLQVWCKSSYLSRLFLCLMHMHWHCSTLSCLCDWWVLASRQYKL